MIDYAPLTKKQTDFIVKSTDCWLNVAEGGKRAGKNIMNLIAWAVTLEKHPDKLHLAAGVSISAAKLNIIDSNGFGLMHIFKGRCIYKKYEDRDALRIMTGTGEKVVLITGGSDLYSAAKIKGNSYGSVYITEVNECHHEFVKECFTRTIASSNRKIFLDLNPKPPAHWFYQEILDFQIEESKKGKTNEVNYAHFTVLDNLSISNKRLKDLLETYDKNSIWYQRDIIGLRTSASGRVYTSYTYEDTAISAEDLRNQRFIELAVGVDVGGTDATVATLCGVTLGFKKLCLIDGMYHKQGISDKMDEAAYARMVVDWLIPWATVYPMLGTVYVDSANKLFRRALENHMIERGLRRFNVRAFNKGDGILARIEFNSMLLAQGRFKIASHMKKWHEAYQMATWNTDDYAKGEWVRTDDGSYPIDALDSAEYGFYGFKRLMM
jgi:PBSX family phage terminase large subunit